MLSSRRYRVCTRQDDFDLFPSTVLSFRQAKTGKDLEYVQFGKPTSAQYDFAEALLMEHAGVKAGDTMPKVYVSSVHSVLTGHHTH